MRKKLILFLFLAVALGLASGCQRVGDLPVVEKKAEAYAQPEAPAKAEDQAKAETAVPVPPDGCAPGFRILFDHAVVELLGEGKGDVAVVSDPLCWHCRLGHKLMGEYSNMWGRMRLSFYPRRGSIGSDMAAWILEDAAGSDQLRRLVDFAYEDLKQPKTTDLMNARMLVLMQFTQVFPNMLKNTTLEALFVRLQSAHEAHVLESAMLAKAVQLPGTPVLVVGDEVVIGFGPGAWLKALSEKGVCK